MWGKAIKSLMVGLTAALALPAVATTDASARVTSLRFELIDLDLNDGIGANMTWGGLASMSGVNNQFGQTFELFAQPDGSLTWGVSFAQFASESSSSDSGFLTSALFANGAATAATTNTDVVTQAHTEAGGQSLTTEAYLFGDFVLSANTELRLTGSAESWISGTGGVDALTPVGVDPRFGVPFSQASTFLEVALGDQSFNQSLSGLNYAPNDNHALYPVADYAGSASSSFTLGWRNEAGDAQAGYFSLIARTSLSQLAVSPPVVPPVPEPSTWILMAMGLVAVGTVCRRKDSWLKAQAIYPG